MCVSQKWSKSEELYVYNIYIYVYKYMCIYIVSYFQRDMDIYTLYQ